MATRENPTQQELDQQAEARREEGPSAFPDPRAPERVPPEGGKAALTDVGGDNGGQRTEVSRPYDGEGGVARGQRDFERK